MDRNFCLQARGCDFVLFVQWLENKSSCFRVILLTTYTVSLLVEFSCLKIVASLKLYILVIYCCHASVPYIICCSITAALREVSYKYNTCRDKYVHWCGLQMLDMVVLTSSSLHFQKNLYYVPIIYTIPFTLLHREYNYKNETLSSFRLGDFSNSDNI